MTRGIRHAKVIGDSGKVARIDWDDSHADTLGQPIDLDALVGAPGPQGEQGIPGDAGLPGAKGDTGDQGAPGAKGDTGEQGIQGEVGPRGDPGLRGDQGLPGNDGAPGAKGDTGDQGLPGAKGDTGEQGYQGVPGNDGAKGDTGFPGADGAPGAKGDTGDQGIQGVPGNDGGQGIQGVPGNDGAPGEQGIQGIQGTPGISNYTLMLHSASQATTTDAQTLYWGGMVVAPSTTASRWRVYIPKAGTIKCAKIYSYAGTAGTGEAWAMSIRLNNTTDTLVQSLSLANSNRVWSNEVLAIAVVPGDYIEIKEVCPTWATNPATVTRTGVVYIE